MLVKIQQKCPQINLSQRFVEKKIPPALFQRYHTIAAPNLVRIEAAVYSNRHLYCGRENQYGNFFFPHWMPRSIIPIFWSLAEFWKYSTTHVQFVVIHARAHFY